MPKAKNKHKRGDAPNTDPEFSFNWFPGHMMKALREIKEKVKQVDIVLEVRDARSPLATGNETLKKYIGGKCHLIVMNKANLAGPEILAKWNSWFQTQKTPFIFLNGMDKGELNKLIKKSKELVNEVHLQSNPDSETIKKLKMMIVGLPNTGKSTIINTLANRDASKVADKPGQTQQQIWVNAREDLDIMDTPGVMPPQIENREQALWLTALHAIPERIIDSEDTACFIVEHLNKTNPQALESQYKISDVQNDLIDTLNKIATARGCIRQKGQFDYERVFKLVINDFRRGKLGLINFGLPPRV